MTLLSCLLQVALALLLAYLGGPFLRNVRGVSDEPSVYGRRRDRLLGLALYGFALVIGAVAASRLAALVGSDGRPYGLLPLVAPAVGLGWILALVVGLRQGASAAAVRAIAIAAVALVVLIVAIANGRIAGGDWFLLSALVVWLVTACFGWRPSAK